MSDSLAGIEVTKDEKAGTVTVNVPGDVLFLSGQAELKESAKGTLNKVVSALKKDYAGKHILVQGYTDKDPISRTKDKWTDNLDLSAARAARWRPISPARESTRTRWAYRRMAIRCRKVRRIAAGEWRLWWQRGSD